MATKQLPKANWFVPITRLDEENRIVEGYCYVNERVESDPYNLTRKAMEKASDDYMKWGAIRAMHGTVAAGSAKSLEWDKKGCFLRAEIVDDQEWKKCQKGVYKGFSVGVNPEVVRGDDVVRCTWLENSLVDRPADPDAVMAVARADGYDPAKAPTLYDVEIEEPKRIVRGDGPDFVSALSATMYDQIYDKVWQAGYALSDVFRKIACNSDAKAKQKEKQARTAIQQYADYIAPLISDASTVSMPKRAEFADLIRTAQENKQVPENTPPAVGTTPTPDAAILARLDTIEKDHKATVTRLEGAIAKKDAEIAKANKKAAKVERKLTAKVARLSGLPVAGHPSVKYPKAGSPEDIQRALNPLERSFSANDTLGTEVDPDEAVTAYNALISKAATETDPAKREQYFVSVNTMKMQLHAQGIDA